MQSECIDVKIEPGLLERDADQNLGTRTYTKANARLDVCARGIFGTFELTFCDVPEMSCKCLQTHKASLQGA